MVTKVKEEEHSLHGLHGRRPTPLDSCCHFSVSQPRLTFCNVEFK